jgi:hypothetical protein
MSCGNCYLKPAQKPLEIDLEDELPQIEGKITEIEASILKAR